MPTETENLEANKENVSTETLWGMPGVHRLGHVKNACRNLEEYADVVMSYVSWCEMGTETKTVALYDIDKGGGQERQV